MTIPGATDEQRLPICPIYMDYCATTPVDPRVVDKMIPYLREQFGNPASRSHAYGWEAEAAVEEAREQRRRAGRTADPREIIWTSGATEVEQPRDQGRGALLQEQGQAPHHGQDRAQGRARHRARTRARRLRSHVSRRQGRRPDRPRASSRRRSARTRSWSRSCWSTTRSA